jgi:uncharacterized protein YqeY
MSNGIKEQLQDDLKAAMKNRDETARDTIRFTLAAIKNAEIDKGGPLSEPEELSLLQRETKRRVDSIDQFRDAGRQDLVNREEAQLAVLRKYMPVELTEKELQDLVRTAIAETGASDVKELGKVMPVAIQRAAGRADGKRLSAAVRDALTSTAS